MKLSHLDVIAMLILAGKDPAGRLIANRASLAESCYALTCGDIVQALSGSEYLHNEDSAAMVRTVDGQVRIHFGDVGTVNGLRYSMVAAAADFEKEWSLRFIGDSEVVSADGDTRVFKQMIKQLEGKEPKTVFAFRYLLALLGGSGY